MALVLTRSVNQSLIINENITVTVSSIIRGQVRLAVVAPREIPVRRAEVEPLPAPQSAEEAEWEAWAKKQ